MICLIWLGFLVLEFKYEIILQPVYHSNVLLASWRRELPLHRLRPPTSPSSSLSLGRASPCRPSAPGFGDMIGEISRGFSDREEMSRRGRNVGARKLSRESWKGGVARRAEPKEPLRRTDFARGPSGAGAHASSAGPRVHPIFFPYTTRCDNLGLSLAWRPTQLYLIY